MVLKFDVDRTLCWVFGIILVGSVISCSTAMAQTTETAQTPFIGFRPFDGSQSVSASAATSSATQSQATLPTRIVPEQPTSAYPYPASGGPTYGAVPNIQRETAERASLGGRLSSVSTPTGALDAANRTTGVGGQIAGVPVNADPVLWQRYQQEIQQQQAWQQNQQYQQWLAQQQQNRQQRQTSTVGFRTPQQSLAAPQGQRAAQPTLATRPDTQVSVARPTKPKLNQPVVQQVSSTATRSRDRSVARADFSSPTATNSTSVAKQATSNANTVAKPQCCCVPQNCCVAPARTPNTPAPMFRPQTVNQAANQVPTLGPGVAGGFLGQSGSNFQVQPQPGFQFQPGLGVPQFSSTGATGGGLFGTGAYTPLLPIVSAQGAQLGQGIIGQPTAYINGQPVRNFLRYIFP